MKVKFTGLMTEIQTGCVPCGRSAVSKKGFASTKFIYLPSGNSKTFHYGEVVEVSQLDGEWLTSWKEHDASGAERQVFQEVK